MSVPFPPLLGNRVSPAPLDARHRASLAIKTKPMSMRNHDALLAILKPLAFGCHMLQVRRRAIAMDQDRLSRIGSHSGFTELAAELVRTQQTAIVQCSEARTRRSDWQFALAFSSYKIKYFATIKSAPMPSLSEQFEVLPIHRAANVF